MPSRPVPTPHHALFREVFGLPGNAASQLLSVLPPDLAARLDLDQLAQAPADFADAALAMRHADLLFTAPLDGREAFIYLHVEHQSSSDRFMALRMAGYMVRIWETWRRRYPKARYLPAVIPVVVYHGAHPWSAPVQLADLLDLDPATAAAAGPYLPRFQYLLDDLTRVNERQLRDRPLTPTARVTLLLLKLAAGDSRLIPELAGWDDELRAVAGQPGGVETFVILLTYISVVGNGTAGSCRIWLPGSARRQRRLT